LGAHHSVAFYDDSTRKATEIRGLYAMLIYGLHVFNTRIL